MGLAMFQDTKMTTMELINEAVRTLGEEEQQVLSLLYGLAGRPQQSPEELSSSLGLAPEVVIEIETRAIRKLRHPIVRKSIMNALENSEQQIWDSLSLSSALVFKKDIPSKVPGRVPGQYLVAIKCILGSIDQWLSNHSCDTPKAWYRGTYPCEDLLKAVDRLQSIHNEMSLPTPLQSLSQIVEAETGLLVIAAALADHCSIYRGYFSKSSMGIRVARTVRLHQILSFKKSVEPITTGRLAAFHNERHPEDPVRSEEVEVVLSRNPHLFLPMGFMVYCGIGTIQQDMSSINCGAPPTSSEMDGRVLRHLSGQKKVEIDAEDVLCEILAARGPSHLREIASEFGKRVGDSIKLQNLKTTLAGSSKMVALAPEFIALEEQRDSATADSSIPQSLMTPRQCRLYATARRAGEPLGVYPLWTPTTEQHWCYWAEQNAGHKLFQSLLAVSDPQLWDDHQAIKNIWSFKKQGFGRFCLDMDLEACAWQQTPSLVQVLSAATCAKQLGYINWLRVQNIIGLQLYTRLYEQNSASVLAILVGLNVVAAPEHWQSAHYLAPAVDEILPILSYELHKSGNVRWSDAIGQEMISRLEGACSRHQLGWVGSNELARLAKTLAERDTEQRLPPSPDKEEPPMGINQEEPLRQLRLPFKYPDR